MADIFQNIAIAALLTFSSIVDIKERRVSNKICLCIVILSLLDFTFWNLSGFIMAFVIFVIALKTGEIGGGDVKLIAALSLCLGLGGMLIMLFCAASAMLIFYSITILIKGKKASKYFPFVPFITFGYLVSILFERII